MLVDELEARKQEIQMINPKLPPKITYSDGPLPKISLLGDSSYEVTQDALESMLNIIRLPIKYIERLVAQDAKWLVEQNINYLLAGTNLCYLMNEKSVITQIFNTNKLYIPMLTINDEVINYFNTCYVGEYQLRDDTFHALYISDQIESAGGFDWNLAIRVSFSDCFSVPPRFDGALYNAMANICWTYPIGNRKFRVAQNSVTEIVDQVKEFITIALDTVRKELIPAIELKHDQEIDPFLTINRLCSELRLSKSIYSMLVEGLDGSDITVLQLVIRIRDACRINNFDMLKARDIQVSISRFIVTGRFKQ